MRTSLLPEQIPLSKEPWTMTWSMVGRWLLCMGGKANGFYDFAMPSDREADCRLAIAAPRLKAALEEILDYRGDASSALDDPYVMERARQALDACEAR
jgi:hypothetical protein